MSDAIKTILYATDLGKHARPALRMAVNLAKTNNAKVLITFVVEPMTAAHMSAVSAFFPSDTVAELNAQSLKKVTQKLQDEIKVFSEEELGGEEFPGGEPGIYVLEGEPAATILKTADKMDADLIVLGSHSHSAIDKLFIGSVANKVINRSTKPVLLVPVKND